MACNWKHSIHQYIPQMLVYLTLLWAELQYCLYNNLLLTFRRISDSLMVSWEGIIFRHFYKPYAWHFTIFPCVYIELQRISQFPSLNFIVKNFSFTCQTISNFCWSLTILTTSQQDLYVWRHASQVWFYNVYQIKCFKHMLYTRMKTRISLLQVFCKFNGLWGIIFLNY